MAVKKLYNKPLLFQIGKAEAFLDGPGAGDTGGFSTFLL